MDLLDELETLAGLAQMADQAEDNPHSEANEMNIQRLDNLFHPSRASQNIMNPSPQPSKPTAAESLNRASKTTYLVKLDGLFSSPSQIQHLAGLLHPPSTHQGVGETGQTTHFCLINGLAKASLLSHLSDKGVAFNPTFIRINRASKDLSSYSPAPTLGPTSRDPTLPHFRASDPSHTYLPTQTQYPVWYFFYGTLADPDILREKLSLPERPVLNRAVVHGGVVTTWRGKYRALVDGTGSERVEGWAYEVQDEEGEEQLRYYETDRYEVVRCEIDMLERQGKVKGLTFRLVEDGD